MRALCFISRAERVTGNLSNKMYIPVIKKTLFRNTKKDNYLNKLTYLQNKTGPLRFS